MGKKSPYSIELASLADGRCERDFEIGKEFFEMKENPDILGADVHVHLEIVKRNSAYYCIFTLKGWVEIPCDRCLESLRHDVDTEYTLTVKYGEEYDDSRDNLLVIPYSDTSLDVSGIIYDTILLTIPLRHVHPDGGCDSAMEESLRRHTSPADAGDDDPDADDGDAAEDDKL